MAIEPAIRRGPDLEALRALEFPICNYEVSREKIAEYVAAVGDRSPLSSDPEAARRAGYRDIIAPPTFAAVFSSMPFRRALADRDWVARSTIDPARILHGEQSYEFRRPIMPGDRLLVQSIVTGAEERPSLVLIYVATRVDNERSERMIDAAMTLVVRL